MKIKLPKAFLKKHGGKLLLAFLAAVGGAMGKWVWEEYIQPKPLYVNIYVFDDASPRHELPGVSVRLYDLHDVTEQTTKEFGTVRFEVSRKHRNEVVTPKFKRGGYLRPIGPSPDKIKLTTSEMSFNYYLTKTPASSPIPTPTVEATPSPTPASAQYEVKTYSSGGRPSGQSDQFSEWYELCNDPEPAGWTIETSSFVLTGDRQCNAWSECKLTQNTPTKVCWQFRMQGHSEQAGGLFNHGNTGVQFSTGNLRVVWKH